MPKKRKGLPRDEPAGSQDEVELTGAVVDGELYLRDPDGRVYAAERDDSGGLVQVGTWDDGAVRPLPPPPAAPDLAPAAPALPPAPPPEPLVFPANEEDHCETAPEAYADVVPLLKLLARSLGVPPASLRIYDPYYCNGAVARHLAAAGFPHVRNVNEDFYAADAAGTIPRFDVLLTNPPYSADHPERLLAYCARTRTPWLALMPNWVYAKPYFAAASDAAPLQFLLVPTKRYHYWTPRGRRSDVAAGGAKARTHGHTNAALGARTSPFVSFWYAGGFSTALLSRLRPPSATCRLCWSVGELPRGVLADDDPRKWRDDRGPSQWGRGAGSKRTKRRKK